MKQRLFTPGPVEVPPAVLAALSGPVLHHRSPEFRALFRSAAAQLAELFLVPGEQVLLLTASGTAGLEAGLLSTVPAGKRVLVVNAGKFGERWLKLAQVYGYDVQELQFAWGSAADPAALHAALQAQPDTAAVLLTHSETSTGVLHDVAALASAARDAAPDALLLVDAVTSLAAVELRPREWQLDVVISGSQKGVMAPPGLAFVWLSERAWASDAGLNPSFYLNLRSERAQQQAGETAWTPATSLVAALDVALHLLLEEGPENIWQRRERLNGALLAGGQALGFTPFAERPSPAVAALRTPAGISAPQLVRSLAEQGMRIAGGQDQLREFLIRPSLLGHADEYDALIVLAGLEQASREAGLEASPGTGVSAALKFLKISAPQ